MRSANEIIRELRQQHTHRHALRQAERAIERWHPDHGKRWGWPLLRKVGVAFLVGWFVGSVAEVMGWI